MKGGNENMRANINTGLLRDSGMVFSSEQIRQINKNTLYETTGLQALSARDGSAVSELRPTENVCWPSPGQPHGGILFTQMDTTMAWAVLSTSGEGADCATVNMVNYFTRQ